MIPTPVFPTGACSIESPAGVDVVLVVDLSELPRMDVEAALGEVEETVELDVEDGAFGDVL